MVEGRAPAPPEVGAREDAAPRPRSPGLVLASTSLGTLLVILLTSGLNIASPAIRTTFGADQAAATLFPLGVPGIWAAAVVGVISLIVVVLGVRHAFAEDDPVDIGSAEAEHVLCGFIHGFSALGNVRRRFRIPVYTDPIEVHHARREYLEQASADDVDKGPMPQTQEWWEKVQKVGATKDLKNDDAKPVGAGPLDIPGRPIAVPTHGHTSGHTAFHLPDSHAVITGDALLTAHPTSQFDGPQLCPWFFAHSLPDALAALDVLEVLDADVILPGHGDPLRMHIAEAVGIARRRAHDSGYNPSRKA